tara:strand:+ start:213 stop:383 length:171 start_codon:yes stop_codon:yes gene_type:complete
MSSILCIVLSIATISGGCLALYAGTRGGSNSMAAKVGGIFITVTGILGLIACVIGE